ncbi:hypothetical protein [Polaromonas sp.]|uniref:hypothetical protein n=1 Tax=Polaromonas sp. TaxID=1869339 RepID=UPI00352BA1C6
MEEFVITKQKIAADRRAKLERIAIIAVAGLFGAGLGYVIGGPVAMVAAAALTALVAGMLFP